MSSSARVVLASSRLALAWVLSLVACDASAPRAAGDPAHSEDLGESADGGAVLVRPDASFGNLAHGQACTRDDMCRGGRCLPAPGYPGGFCTLASCRTDADCDDPASECIRRVGPDICAPRCASSASCRADYACFAVEGSPEVCLPATQRPSVLRPDGAPCAASAECLGGTCYLGPEWPDGYCTTTFCAADEGCAPAPGGSAACLYLGVRAETFCAASCIADAECREGYTCQPVRVGQRVCVPEEESRVREVGSYPFGMTCGVAATDGEISLDYAISERATSYTLTLLTRDAAFLRPRSLALPSGGRVDFTGDHDFLAITSELTGWLQPLTFPAVPQDAALHGPGAHRLLVETESRDLCWYLIEESAPGSAIDLNFYFIGVEGLDAARAGSDPHFRAMLGVLDQILAGASLRVGRVRYFDVTGPDADRLSIIRSEADIGRAAAVSIVPGEDLDASLSVNVIFVQAIAIGALGVATGIPGPPALHETKGSGVVVTGELFGQMFSNPSTGAPIDGDAFTAIVVAHEVGHFLGLFHTTEGNLMSTDPLLDTPECTPELFPELCPDRNNLMFPFDPGTSLTPAQAFSLGAHVLTKE